MNLETGDDLGNDIAEAIKSSSVPETPVVPAPGDAAPPSEGKVEPPSVEPSEGERARDDKGRFAKKEEAPEPAKTEAKPAETTQASAPKAPDAPPTPAPAADRIAPPQHWKGTGKVEWARLPKNVQQAIADDYKNFEDVTAIKSAIAPHEQNLKLAYGDTGLGLSKILTIAAESEKNPTGFLLWFAQQKGVNLAQLVQPGQAQGQQPHTQGMQQQPQVPNQQYMTREEVAIEVERQTRANIAKREIEAFASNPDYPYFNDVRQHMALLMQHGQATTISEAYESACYARPDIRQQLLADKAEKERSEQEKRNAEAVANAKRANGSLTGSPAGSKVPNDAPEKTLEAEVAKHVNARF